jgi:ABC-type sugar transport system permease subunit
VALFSRGSVGIILTTPALSNHPPHTTLHTTTHDRGQHHPPRRTFIRHHRYRPPFEAAPSTQGTEQQVAVASKMEEEDEWSIMPFLGDGSNTTSNTSTSTINRYSVLWGLALTGFSLTLLIALPYLACLLARPPSKIRRFYGAATSLPLVFAVSALATCLAPGSDDYWGLLQHVCEAWALHSLNQVGRWWVNEGE